MKRIPLGEVAEVKSGFAFRSEEYTEKGIKLARIGNIIAGELYFDHDSICVSNEFATSHSEFLIQPQDVLIAMSGATTGKVGIAKERDLPSLLNQRVGRFSVRKEKLDPIYLFYYLSFDKVREQILKVSGGSAQPNISPSQLKSLTIPLTELKTQRQIANILSQADKARQQRKAANALTDQFLQSTFLSMFGDPVRNEKGWDRGTIRDVAAEVRYGTSKPAEADGSYPYLRMNNITYSGQWDFSSLKHISLKENEKDKYLARRGDLVFNRTNSKELVGKTAVYNRDEEMALAGYLIRVRMNEKATPEYVSAFLNSSFGKETLRGMCKNIVGMANINAQELQDIAILLPPLHLQQQFAAIVAQTEALRQRQRAHEEELEKLFQGLLQKYFG